MTLTEQRKTRFRHLQDRLGDPLLTALTILLALMLFVIAPLHAAGVFASEDVGLAVAMVVIGTVVFAYGFSPAVIVLLVALALAAVASVLRHQHQSPLDLYLDASAWVLLGLALGWVVAPVLTDIRANRRPPLNPVEDAEASALHTAATQNKQQYDDDQKCGGAHVVLSALENCGPVSLLCGVSRSERDSPMAC
jgi:hypothetical protein